MTHLLDKSALLAHYLAESGCNRVQQLFEDETRLVGTSILVFFEFELRLRQLGLSASEISAKLVRYRALFSEVVNVDEEVRQAALQVRMEATARIAAMDTLIAATASVRNATLVHRDPHFLAIPATLLKQEILPVK
jgi:predicted nucleic acid-binding protein